MNRWLRLLRSLGTLIVIAAVTGCAGTLPPPAALPASRSASTSAPFPGLAEWDLLVLNDGTDKFVENYYAKLIEADQKVRVIKARECYMDQLGLVAEADYLKGTPGPQCDGASWPDLVREAEVIVFTGGAPSKSKPADGSWDAPHSWTRCLDGGLSLELPDAQARAAYSAAMTKSCAPETFATYRADLGAVFDQIFALRGGRPVILRTTNAYIPVDEAWQKAGVVDACRACFSNFAAAVEQASTEHGVPVANTLDALNGPDHSLDAGEQGYLFVDGFLLSEKGAQRVAEALRQTGYAYAGK